MGESWYSTLVGVGTLEYQVLGPGMIVYKCNVNQQFNTVCMIIHKDNFEFYGDFYQQIAFKIVKMLSFG